MQTFLLAYRFPMYVIKWILTNMEHQPVKLLPLKYCQSLINLSINCSYLELVNQMPINCLINEYL